MNLFLELSNDFIVDGQERIGRVEEALLAIQTIDPRGIRKKT